MHRARVFIVEDELIVASDISATVSRFGYEVIGTSSTGEEALTKISELTPDLVLLDIILAGEMDGIQVAEQLHNKLNIPFIYLTASSDKATLDRAKTTAPYAYITKPFQEQEIFTAIETALYKAEMEKRIKENEKWLSAMLNGIGEGIISIDMEEKITFMNPVAEKLTGYSHQDLEGKPWKEYIHINKSEDSIPDFSLPESYKNVLIVRQTDCVLTTKDNQKIPVDMNKSPIVDEQGFISGVIITLSDVTERKKAEDIIKKAAHEWKTTFDAITDMVFMLDSDRMIMRCNAAVSNKANLPFEEIIGNHIFEIFKVNPKIEKGLLAAYDRMRDTLKRVVTEFTADGSWFTGRLDPILMDNTFFGSVITLSDITEKKKAERELEKYRDHLEEMVEKRTDELQSVNKSLHDEISVRKMVEEQLLQAKEAAESSNKSKSEFLANMSHELRTPLNSIIGFAKLMKMGVDEEDFESYVNNIVSSGNHLLKMINDILDLSKIEAGKIKIEKSEVSVDLVVAETTDIMEIQAEKKNIKLSKDIAEEDITVYADQKRLRQVLLNLVSNAVKFTPENGKIEIKVYKKNRFCYFEVKDSGIGIDKEHQEFIFEKFNQIDTGLSKESEGTGLGLSITKNIVEQHQGRIFLESEKGKGSTFTFSIPLFSTTDKSEEEVIEKKENTQLLNYPENIKNKKILFITNDGFEKDKLSTFFNYQKQNFECIRRNEFHAETLTNSSIDIVIMSLENNPQIEKKFLDKIKSLKNIPVIALSRIVSENEKKVIHETGFDNLILKPVDFNDVIEIIKNY